MFEFMEDFGGECKKQPIKLILGYKCELVLICKRAIRSFE
jgi:hypothetical protein